MRRDELGDLARGCMLASFPGTTVPGWVHRELAGGLGGVVLFASNVRGADQVARLTGNLRSGRPDLLVAVDEEGGEVTRLEAAAGSSYPGGRALGAACDPELTAEVAGAIARELARAGANLNLAPVADLEGGNPAIAGRAFGTRPDTVARHVAAFVTGTQRQGVAACVKHFPGHGGADGDSHVGAATVDATRLGAALEPFRAAIGASVQAVMAGHLRVPALDPEPASLSRALIGLLRAELAFDGLVITDALDMAGTGVAVEDAAVRALAAGVDALCLGPSCHGETVPRVRDAIVDAVAAGRLSAERLAEAAARVRRTAAWCRASPAGSAAGDRALGRQAALRALTASGDVALRAAPVVVEVADGAELGIGGRTAGLGAALRRRLPQTRIVRAGALPAGAVAAAGEVVLVLHDGDADARQRSLARELIDRCGRVVVVETGRAGAQPAGAAGYLVTHGAGRASVEAAAQVLAGAA